MNLFVARIALCNKNVGEILRHGGGVKGVIDFTPSRPKGWNLSTGPTLWVVYQGIDVYFYVNETKKIVVPGYLYGKKKMENGTFIVDGNGTCVIAFNGSDIWFSGGM
ncbi:hypothetical protein J2128_000307 [Methanomicrobium sp. W14]|uniref:hypothetical protein n=1 Tax=Methanomicrobium sp. W14 TaxID=2817839 RepID=UPI001FD88759|nr:hypothetical protein [Methanomicrobium sp. W14]MBP2132386.1 hypothetical protein [Methanomicrobium sp. W14]